jgi:dynein heavy chain 2
MGRVTTLIKEWKDVMTEVSDHQAMVVSIRDSKWAPRFKDYIEKYEHQFGILEDSLLKLNQIQRKWIYL